MNEEIVCVLVNYGGKTILDCRKSGMFLNSEQAAVELVGICGENDTHLLLFSVENVPEAFFDLRTRLAGDILQKFAVYSVKAAMVAAPEITNAGRFGEMAWEANRGNQFHIFTQEAAALAWLANS